MLQVFFTLVIVLVIEALTTSAVGRQNREFFALN